MIPKEISAVEASKLIKQGNIGLIDVREPAEHSTSHIIESKSHPLGTIDETVINQDKNAYIIYCQKGSRGKKACEKLLSQNPNINIYNMNGGIESWIKQGYEIRKGEKSVLPLDRQVQLSISSLLLLFSALSLTVSSDFIWPVVFIAIGLFIAGATGFCGLARLIALMPWNQKA